MHDYLHLAGSDGTAAAVKNNEPDLITRFVVALQRSTLAKIGLK
ncbi:hypothetical protein [Microcystis aeruginosa]|nr:hypothetical protein [Microcystis aeruginosa]